MSLSNDIIDKAGTFFFFFLNIPQQAPEKTKGLLLKKLPTFCQWKSTGLQEMQCPALPED